MSDPRRLIDDPNVSPLGHELLSSTNEDGPSSESRKASARRLGIAVGAASVVSGEAVATGSAIWWKLVTIAVIASGVAIGLITHGGGDTAAPAISAPPVPPVPPVPQLAPSPAVPATPPAVVEPPLPAIVEPPAPPRHHVTAAAPPPPAAEPAPPAPAPAVEPTPAEPAPVVEPTPPPPAPPPVQVDARRLAAEVALLDRARAAVHAKDVAGALALVDEHRRDFADGALVAEAELVRIEALVAGGRAAEASEAGHAFLTRFPHSPLAQRVRSLISSSK